MVMIKKYWEVIDNMTEEKLRNLIKSFLVKRFGQNVLNDKEYVEKWFVRFREEKSYLGYMDKKSRGIFFSLLSLEGNR